MNTGESAERAHTQTHPNSARDTYHMPYTADKVSNTEYFKIYNRGYTVSLFSTLKHTPVHVSTICTQRHIHHEVM